MQSFTVEIDESKSTSPLPYHICENGKLNRFVYKISGNIGNAPSMIALSSIVGFRDNYPSYISNHDEKSTKLYIESQNGLAFQSKLCNGIGKCDFSSGVCECPMDWGPHPDLGPCGGLALNASTWEGFSRCQGVVSPSSFSMASKRTLNMVPNNRPLAFLSLNPVDLLLTPLSTIYAIPWDVETIRGSVFDTDTATHIITLTSDNAAGPIVYDQSKDQIFFVNNDPNDLFIGFVSVDFPLDGATRTYTKYVVTEGIIQSFVFDAHFHRRNLYWSIPTEPAIYMVNADIQLTNANTAIQKFQSSLIVNPTGISLMITENKLYWTDILLDTNSIEQGVINQANLDLTDQVLFHQFTSDDPDLPISKNLKGNIIHLNMNNTMFILDSGDSSLATPILPQVIAVNLDNPVLYDTDPDVEEHNEQYYSPRIIVSNNDFAGISDPNIIAIDFQNFVMIWTEPSLKKISFLRYKMTYVDITSPGTSFTGINDLVNFDPEVHISIPQVEYIPVGVAFSNSLSTPNFGNYLDCYGSGVCLGIEHNFMCECYPGFEGDCQKRTCPTGLAWFHEPKANNIAHDVYSECSGVGVCDFFTGICKCNPGFEGPACERMSCQAPTHIQSKLKRDAKKSITNTTTSSSTSNYFQFHTDIEIEPPCGLNGGRCLSMQSLGKYHLNTQKDYDPVKYSKFDQLKSPMTWDSDRIFGCKADQYGYYYGEFYVNEAKDFYYGSHYQCPAGIYRRYLEDEEAKINGFIENNSEFSGVEIHNDIFTNRPSLSPTAAPSFGSDFKYIRLTPTTEKDMLTSGVLRREVQTLVCIAKDGYFRIKFRGKVTDKISAKVSQYELKLYLESLPTVGKVNVRYSFGFNDPNIEDGELCREDHQNYAEIEFLSLVGSAPLIQIVDSNLVGSIATIDVYSIQKASDEGIFECSDRGICNENIGECECKSNYVFSKQNNDIKWTYFSSNGFGSIGTRDDCGIFLNK